MDAFELLKSDHEKVSQLFKETESATDREKRQLFARLKNELDVHAHIEEKVFYPALENTEEARDITLEAYEEHKVVKDLLAELSNNGTPNDEWDAKLTVLKENVEHHVEEEEGELFSKARQVLSAEEIERCGAEMEAEKARQQGGEAKTRSGRESSPEDSTPSKRKSRTALKKKSPGVLTRLAKLVGLGSGSSGGSRKSAPKRAKKPSVKPSSSEGRSSKPSRSAASRKSNRVKPTSKAGSTAKKAGKSQGASASRGAKRVAPRSAASKRAKERVSTKRSKAR